MASTSRLLWLIDDTDHWHQVTEATVQRCLGWRFVGFQTALAGIMAYKHAVGTAACPAVILCDFYLDGSWRGDAMCRELRLIEEAGSHQPAYMVGHSTSPTGSNMIVQAGADVVVPKHGQDTNRSLELFLKNFTE